MEKHVIDVVIEIKVVLHLLVNAIVSDITIEKIGHGIPTRPRFRHGMILIYLPVLFSTPKVFSIPIVFNSLS